MSDMPHLQAELSEEANDGWDKFVRYHGLTKTALAEAIGLQLQFATQDPPEWVASLIEPARHIAADRLKRGKP